MGYKLSTQMKEIISFSRDEAERLGNDHIGTEHLLLALLREGDPAALRLLNSFQVDLVAMKKEIELAVKPDKGYQNSMPLDAGAEQAIHGAVAEAKALQHKRVEPEHLILSILNNSRTAPAILNHIRRK